MEEYLQKLKENSLKITAKRRALIGLLVRKNKFLSPEQIYNVLKKKFNRISLPSIYRNLNEMENIGLLVKVQKPDRRLYYALCRADEDKHHHHIVCVKCGMIGEFYGCDILKKKEINGFKVQNHSLQLEGVCPGCQKK